MIGDKVTYEKPDNIEPNAIFRPIYNGQDMHLMLFAVMESFRKSSSLSASGSLNRAVINYLATGKVPKSVIDMFQ